MINCIKNINSVAVFCGSAPGADNVYIESAKAVGQLLARRGIRLIYGGARVGLMGAVADAAMEAGGEVLGVLPRFLQTKEIAHDGLTELFLTDTMHERKLMMHELSDAIITLPGGFGTMEELFEMLTWAQLGLHAKPIGLLNVCGYYDALIQFCRQMERQGFLRPSHAAMLLHHRSATELLAQMETYVAPQQPIWLAEESNT